MKKERFKLIPACLCSLRKGNQVFLLRRAGTGFADGQLTLPSGHVEEGETFRQAMVREVKEEAGVDINPDHLRMAHVMHRVGTKHEYVDMFFECEMWEGVPHVSEPDKSDHAGWYDIQDLPNLKIVPFVRTALEKIEEFQVYSERGFPE
jgi:8-oxo-dGTP pyrophosphatase MutT (NUDIX family)